MGYYGRSAEVYELRRKIQEEKLGLKEGKDYSVTYDGLGCALLWTGSVEKAIPILEKCLELKKACDGPEAPSCAVTLFELSIAHFVHEDADKAQALMKECQDVRAKLAPAEGQELSAKSRKIVLLFSAVSLSRSLSL